MVMKLHTLPDRTGSAAENMALDFLLLQRYPQLAVRFRHYDWRRAAFTFGYSQKYAFVRGQVAALGGDPAAFDLCRRPTGGGVVDHREDWTYALVIPRGHPLEEVPAVRSYRAVHEALAAALRAQGVPAEAKAVADEPAGESGPVAPGVCFQKAELYDVIDATTGAKIAGAAQKRNKHGLLFQGSVWRPAAGAGVDWDRLREDFIGALAAALSVEAEAVPWPDLAEHEVEGLTEQYATPEWNESR